MQTRRPSALLLLAAALLAASPAAAPAQSPNVVVIFADDLGYGDLGAYGHPTLRTPALDRMAAEGMRFTQFYTGASVCTPSRAALLTGRLPVRSGTMGRPRVFFPNSSGGLPAEEITIAEALKARGYATGMVGKWHLGHLPRYLPTRQGFDSYYGIPYSNDMTNERRGDPPLPLLRDERIEEAPVDQTTLTRRYTEEAVRFIRDHREGPFFLYLAHNFPHVPLFASDRFRGRSPRGLYGDVVEELDWSVGEVLRALREAGVAENTLVFFTSDNGPWLTQDEEGGSAGLLREGKGSTWEGGMRVPAIAWWPGTVPAGRVTRALGTTMDLFSTALALAGAPAPADRPIDGVDLGPVLRGAAESVRDEVFYYREGELYAVRQGPWKAHFVTRSAYGPDPAVRHETPELYHLEVDPSERYDVAAKHPEVVERIRATVRAHEAGLIRAPDQMAGVLPPPPARP